MRTLIFFLALLASSGASAVEVLGVVLDRDLVALTRDEDVAWSVEERVCLLRNWQRVACGNVVKVGAKGIIVLATIWTSPIRKGDIVEIIKLDSMAKIKNVSLGLNYFFPTIQIEQMFHRNFSYGVMPMILMMNKGGYDYKSVATLATLNYYRHSFRGLWARFGIGVHIGNMRQGGLESTKDGITSILFNLTLGYRFVFGSRYNIGLGAGFNYFPHASMHVVTMSAGILPSVVLDFGVKF